MEQRITVRIADREYVLMAPTPESEEYIRIAADAISKKIAGYSAKFPGKNMVDILSFVALNEGIGSVALQRKFEAVMAEAATLKTQMPILIILKNSRQFLLAENNKFFRTE